MKLSKKQRPLLATTALMMLVYASGAMAANCTATDSKTETLNFGASLAGTSLTIASGTPIGTVVYQDSVQAAGHNWKCTSSSMFGVALNSALGTVDSSTTTFPLGKTGLSFRLWIDPLDRYQWSLQSIPANSSYGIGAGTYRLEIIKSAELPAQSTFPGGYLAKLQGGELVFSNLNLINPIVLNSASCETPSVPVQMGDDYHLQDFSRVGDTPRVVKFNIGLNQCQSGIKKVTYSLKATTKIIDAQKGIVALNASSTAKGIGLQLMNEAGQPIALGTTYPFTAFNTTGTDFKIPLSAAYYRLAEDAIQAGSANTEVTFIVNYL